MSLRNTPLTQKTVAALLTWLRTSQLLVGVASASNVNDAAKLNGQITVQATQNEEVVFNSQIFQLDVSVKLEMKNKAGANSARLFADRSGELARMLAIGEFALAEQLSLCADSFHCYSARFTGGDETQDGDFSVEYQLSLEAMTVSYREAQVNN